MLKKILKKRLTKIKNLQGVEPEVFFTTEEKFGHYTTNLALILAKKNKKSPQEVGRKIIEWLKEDQKIGELFDVSFIGCGFINFFIKDQCLISVLKDLLKNQVKFGQNDFLKGKKIMVEYAHPNPFKAFHIGHLRTLIIGETLARIFTNASAKVIRANYQGDIGLHVAKCFWGMRKRPQKDFKNLEERVNYLGKVYVIGSRAYKEDEEAKKEIHTINQELYSLQKKALKKEWQEKRQWSIDKFEQIFLRLGAKFDHFYFESEMAEDGLSRCFEAEKKGVLKKDDGCLIFEGEKYGLNNRVFVNKLGIPTYEGKELGLAFREFTDFGRLDKNIHVVANEQINFFKITFLVQRLLDKELFLDKQYQLAYGMVNLKGQKMSSREGNIILGEKILDDVKQEVLQVLEKKQGKAMQFKKETIAERLAIASVKFAFLKVNAFKDIAFDLKESVRIEGKSGPYLMYALVRAKKLLDKAKPIMNVKTLENDWEDPLLQKTELLKEERRLIYLFLKFPYFLEKVAKDYQISFLVEYSYSLAVAFANFYDNIPVLKEKDTTKQFLRLRMIEGFIVVMRKCFWILGIEEVEEM